MTVCTTQTDRLEIHGRAYSFLISSRLLLRKSCAKKCDRIWSYLVRELFSRILFCTGLIRKQCRTQQSRFLIGPHDICFASVVTCFNLPHVTTVQKTSNKLITGHCYKLTQEISCIKRGTYTALAREDLSEGLIIEADVSGTIQRHNSWLHLVYFPYGSVS